jgi:hypothetical protein
MRSSLFDAKDDHMSTRATALSLPLLVSLLGGCAESNFIIPYPPGEEPSRLWSNDPRTRGWDGVVVEYTLYGDGSVVADVRSADGRHHFKEQGRGLYENERGERFESCISEDLLFVALFGDREERYRCGKRMDVDRGVMTVYPPATKPSPMPVEKAKQTAIEAAPWWYYDTHETFSLKGIDRTAQGWDVRLDAVNANAQRRVVTVHVADDGIVWVEPRR